MTALKECMAIEPAKSCSNYLKSAAKFIFRSDEEYHLGDQHDVGHAAGSPSGLWPSVVLLQRPLVAVVTHSGPPTHPISLNTTSGKCTNLITVCSDNRCCNLDGKSDGQLTVFRIRIHRIQIQSGSKSRPRFFYKIILKITVGKYI
jgi:hypothetical protein